MTIGKKIFPPSNRSPRVSLALLLEADANLQPPAALSGELLRRVGATGASAVTGPLFEHKLGWCTRIFHKRRSHPRPTSAVPGGRYAASIPRSLPTSAPTCSGMLP